MENVCQALVNQLKQAHGNVVNHKVIVLIVRWHISEGGTSKCATSTLLATMCRPQRFHVLDTLDCTLHLFGLTCSLEIMFLAAHKLSELNFLH